MSLVFDKAVLYSIYDTQFPGSGDLAENELIYAGSVIRTNMTKKRWLDMVQTFILKVTGEHYKNMETFFLRFYDITFKDVEENPGLWERLCKEGLEGLRFVFSKREWEYFVDTL